MSRALKLGGALRELRFHLCQKGDTSKGVREFLQANYVNLKTENPKFPILVRECSGIQPRLWARYDLGKESSVSLTNMSNEEVLNQLKSMLAKS